MTGGPPPTTLRAVLAEAAWLAHALVTRIRATLDNLRDRTDRNDRSAR